MVFPLWVEALRPNQYFSHVGTISWVEPELSNEDEVSCSRTQHRIPGEILTCDLAIKSPALYQWCSPYSVVYLIHSYRCPINEYKVLNMM